MAHGSTPSALADEIATTRLAIRAEASGKEVFATWHMRRLRSDDVDAEQVWLSFAAWALETADLAAPAREPANDWTGDLADLWTAYRYGWCAEAERHNTDPILWGYCWHARRREWSR